MPINVIITVMILAIAKIVILSFIFPRPDKTEKLKLLKRLNNKKNHPKERRCPEILYFSQNNVIAISGPRIVKKMARLRTKIEK
jgi:hypothetical protein